jgi:hypothetical protein
METYNYLHIRCAYVGRAQKSLKPVEPELAAASDVRIGHI